jgi:hypothetical protein
MMYLFRHDLHFSAKTTRSIVHDEIIGLPSWHWKSRIPVLPTAGGGTKA